MRIPTLTALTLTLAALSFVPAHADLDPCSVDAGSSATPHQVDATGDYNAYVFGDGGGGYGDLYGDSNDITKAWIARDPATGLLSAHMETKTWTGVETNLNVFIYWTFQGTSPENQARRFVFGAPDVRGNWRFQYGYREVNPMTGGGSLTFQGSTTGTVTLGTPSEFSIDIKPTPTRLGGAPKPGDVYGALNAQTAFLVAPPGQTLLWFTVDQTADAEGCQDVLF